jgi:arylsulfatase
MDGLSFAPTLLGAGEQAQHEVLYWEIPGYGGQQALRLGKWKGIREDVAKGQRRLKLYDLERDPGESQDLSGLQSSVVRRMEEILAASREPSAAFPFRGLDP